MCTRSCSPSDMQDGQCICHRENRFCFEPLSYYRNDAERRAFLLIYCPQAPTDHQVCYLLEFGYTQRSIKPIPAADFQKLIEEKKLIPFTPKYHKDEDWTW